MELIKNRKKIICGSVFFNIIENNIIENNIRNKLYNSFNFKKEILDYNIAFDIIDCVGKNFVTHCMIIYGYCDLDLSCINIRDRIKDLISIKFDPHEIISINIDCFISKI